MVHCSGTDIPRSESHPFPSFLPGFVTENTMNSMAMTAVRTRSRSGSGGSGGSGSSTESQSESQSSA